jgi:hypothetical protein
MIIHERILAKFDYKQEMKIEVFLNLFILLVLHVLEYIMKIWWFFNFLKLGEFGSFLNCKNPLYWLKSSFYVKSL